MNRTLLDRVRSIRVKCGLSKKFWSEAVCTAAYLINRSPSVPLKDKCPETVFTGKPLDLSNLRVFGCAAYIHQKNDKLKPRSKKCVFLGYPEGVKGYRVWVKDELGFKIAISRDVVFNEFEFPCLPSSTPIALPAPLTDNMTTSSEVELPEVNPDMHSDVENENVNDNNVNHDSDVENDYVPDSEHENDNNNSDDKQNYQLARDRVRRTTNMPTIYIDCDLGSDSNLISMAFNVFESLDNCEPKTYNQAVKSKHADKWLEAMQNEMRSLHVNKTWDLIPKPAKCSVVDCKWLFKIKQEFNNVRFKTRLVAKGFTQKEEIDYTEVFAPVVKFTTVRMMLALVAHFDWEMYQMYVTTAFLHGDLDKPIYMNQPEGFVDSAKPNYVCYLKSLSMG